jgi:hypothetical protein
VVALEMVVGPQHPTAHRFKSELVEMMAEEEGQGGEKAEGLEEAADGVD